MAALAGDVSDGRGPLPLRVAGVAVAVTVPGAVGIGRDGVRIAGESLRRHTAGPRVPGCPQARIALGRLAHLDRSSGRVEPVAREVDATHQSPARFGGAGGPVR